MSSGEESQAIVYEGIVPDNFNPQADLRVDGRYRPDNTVEALSFGGHRPLCNFCH